MMLHVSDLELMERCERLAWLHYHDKPQVMPFYHSNMPFTQVWSKAFGIEDVPQGRRGDNNDTTLAMLDSSDVVRHARFEWKGLRVNIPWLEKTDKGWKAIYPHMASSCRQTEAWHMLVDRLVAEKCGIAITDWEVIFLNKEYVRGDVLDLDRLFIRKNHLYNRRGRPTKPIAELHEELDIDLDALIERANRLFAGPCPKASLSRACHAGRRCVHYDECFHPEEMDGRDIEFLKGIPHADKNGAVIDELDPELLKDSPVVLAQYEACKNSPYIDRQRLLEWMRDVTYPISYLDFEWDSYAVPPFEKMKPFDVLCFQYSLHIEDGDGLRHKSFFGTGDCRIDFIESLIRDVPVTGTIFVYNMEGAEQLRLKQLARQFPQYETRLEQIWSRMKDLSKPFENGMYYDLSMKGRFSLKNVTALFDGSYSSLAIRNGLEAVAAYRDFDRQDAQTQHSIREELDKYCGMDTYAEVLVWHGLQQAIKEEQDA